MGKVGGSCSGHCKMFSGIIGICSVNGSSTSLPNVTINVSRHCQSSSRWGRDGGQVRGKNCPGLRATTETNKKDKFPQAFGWFILDTGYFSGVCVCGGGVLRDFI